VRRTGTVLRDISFWISSLFFFVIGVIQLGGIASQGIMKNNKLKIFGLLLIGILMVLFVWVGVLYIKTLQEPDLPEFTHWNDEPKYQLIMNMDKETYDSIQNQIKNNYDGVIRLNIEIVQ